ncbi:hypothetical protein [Sediminibacillus halophilus]|uniref:Uncharacterized protein n=1 Tax=Sediminibacillus halophilus TaxID=482461 RepID=A0A1G9RC42_9BACI|nr:hypothetical protein [Sediminibacillus halophilus]SDM20437.1 hypothetical protein SAMN05216244_1909 [Sediminibacillus halophilus]
MAVSHCKQCEHQKNILKQHEDTITQLLEIIAVTNRKLAELEAKHSELEKVYFFQQQAPRFTVPHQASHVTPMLPHLNK